MSFFIQFSLAVNVLTVPPPCSSLPVASTLTTSDDVEIDDKSSKNDLVTIEQINEIFEKQIKKLEDSSNIEVKNF